MTAQAAATLRQQHELLNQAQAAGLALSPQQRAEIEQLGAAMAAAEEKTRSLTEAQEGARQAGQFLGDGLTNAFADVILNAQSAEDAIAGLLQQLARAAIQAALMGGGPLGGLVGGKGLLSGLLGFSQGGYTGVGGKHVPAGIVHKGEVVWSQDDVRRHGGPAVVDAMRRLPRFAEGGIVGSAPALPGIRAGAPAVTINAPVTVNASGGTPEQNADLARQTAREMENVLRGVVVSELAQQLRPGNRLGSRS